VPGTISPSLSGVSGYSWRIVSAIADIVDSSAWSVRFVYVVKKHLTKTECICTVPVTSTSSILSLFSESLGISLLDSNRCRISLQFFRAVAITGSWVRARSWWANAKPNPREAGVTRANPCFTEDIAKLNCANQKGEQCRKQSTCCSLDADDVTSHNHCHCSNTPLPIYNPY
jgi:hypothetical protein